MNPLEEALLTKLIEKYRAKGVNVQRILENPEFARLPLASKIEALDRFAEDFGKTPPLVRAKNVGKGALTGALGLAAAVAATRAARGVPIAQALAPHVMVSSGVYGAAVGALTSGLTDMARFRQDNKISKAIQSRLQEGLDHEDNSLDILVNRTFLKPISSPEPVNILRGSLLNNFSNYQD